MHDEIIRYSLDGEIADSNVVKRKEELMTFLKGKMRDMGCSPSIDLDPQFTLDYQPERGIYKFALSMYGIFVGGDKAWDTAGVMDGKTIQKSIRQTKSKES